MTIETTIDSFGRVLVPKALRDRLGLEPGSVLEMEDSGAEIRLRPVRDRPLLVKEGKVLVYAGKASGNVLEAVKAHREARLRRLPGPRRLRLCSTLRCSSLH
jgi:AbrB family looped-hinge helix DNA binding protein